MKHFFFKENIDYKKRKRNFFVVENKDIVTKKVTDFYADLPFPNYDNFETLRDLSKKLENNVFLKNFKKELGFGKKIIEVGSGTSQLSIMLAHNTNNFVVAFDPTIQSLMLGYDFAEKNNLNNCFFLNGDIFNDPIKHGSFDVVWCTGVLHHTKDSLAAFNIISKWLKPGGIMVLGLYNKYGRLRTNFRQFMYNILGNSLGTKYVLLFDPYLRKDITENKINSWINDQYKHPVERSHTIDETLKWFNINNIDVLNTIPSSDLSNDNFEQIFLKKEKGNLVSRIIAQILMLFSNQGSEGGLFIIYGRKKSNS